MAIQAGRFAPALSLPIHDRTQSGVYRFLNCARALGFPPDWRAANMPKLWRYNLNYFEWLWSLEYADAKAAVLDWIERSASPETREGWEPYPTSLRLVNWLGYFLGAHRAETLADEAFAARLLGSLGAHAEWAARRIEYHLLGNHVLENATALTLAGTMLAGKRAARWRRKGLGLLREQIAEQFLTDGTHFERSPMYHSRMLYLLTILEQVGDAELGAAVRPAARAACGALARLRHPDGRIALLNDSAFGIYSEPDDLLAAQRALGATEAETGPGPAGAWSLPAAGYFGWRDDRGNYVVCDAAELGPSYQPGHAHADLLAFELSLRGHRVVVDAGVHDYEVGETRAYCRSTAAHNTVEIDGQDQAEMWSAFRIARRAHPREVAWRPRTDGFELSAWHDGYLRLPAKARHARTFAWAAGAGLTIADRVTARRTVDVASRLHLHPSCAIVERSDRRVVVAYTGGRFSVASTGPQTIAVEPSRYCPEFGVIEENAALVVRANGTNVESGWTLRHED